MIRGVQLAMDVARRPALAAVCRGPHLAPASTSDADVWSFIERHTQTFYHPSSTCGIGRVVDPELRVFAMEGLRVADASVMPSVIRGNTNAPVIAIAERAAAASGSPTGLRNELLFFDNERGNRSDS